MKLRTGLQLGAVFPIVMATLVAAGLISRARVSEQVTASLGRVETLIGSITDLEGATLAYAVSPDEQAAERWRQAHGDLGRVVVGMKYGSFLEKYSGERIRQGHEALGEMFARLEEGAASVKSGGSSVEFEKQNHLMSRELREMSMAGIQLAKAAHDTATEKQKAADYIIGPLFGILALMMAGGVLLVGRRVTERLASVRAGMGAVSDGRYGNEITVRGDDDLDQLAHTFNRMSRQMHESYSSLTEETKKHEVAAAALRKSNMMIADALERLRRAQSQIIDTERLSALKQMAGGIAHDLNSTLTPILGLTDFMLEYPIALDDRESIVENLKLMNAAVKKTREQVKRLSGFFKPTSETEMEEVDLNAVIAESIETTRPRWQEETSAAGISVDVSAVPGKVPPIRVNKFAVNEILANLILNSVDAMPGGGKIVVSSTADDRWATITVKDNGQGMSDEVKRRCFEPFFSTKGDKASGMGLTAVHNSVKRHGGDIEIDSREGAGTTVTVRLPLERSEVPSVPKPAGAVTALSGLNLLIIDDEQWVRRVFTKIFRSDGHNVEAAADGAEGLAMFRKSTFDAVLVDRAMPGMNGDEVALALKRQKPETPVILLTGFGDVMKAEGDCPEGVDLVVGKPASIEELRNALATVVRKSCAP